MYRGIILSSNLKLDTIKRKLIDILENKQKQIDKDQKAIAI